jgi:hypothetical protein
VEREMAGEIFLVEAVHELLDLGAADMQAAVSEFKRIMGTGRITARAVIEGMATRIDPRWWYFASLRLPLNQATLQIIDPPTAAHDHGKLRTVRATEITLDREVWDRWLRRPAQLQDQKREVPHHASSDTPVPPGETTYRTGLAGKPTSWHLIETECRRRFAAGEIHLTTAEWATVLRDWLASYHSGAMLPTEKTLTNRLPRLLRELKSTTPKTARDIGRPK